MRDDPQDVNARANRIAEKSAAGEDVTKEASELLASLRWHEDMVVTNYEGERVWLAPCFDKEGKRHGITDCCLESDPCDYHRDFAGALNVEVKQ